MSEKFEITANPDEVIVNDIYNLEWNSRVLNHQYLALAFIYICKCIRAYNVI